jgi:hypothetical protein
MTETQIMKSCKWMHGSSLTTLRRGSSNREFYSRSRGFDTDLLNTVQKPVGFKQQPARALNAHADKTPESAHGFAGSDPAMPSEWERVGLNTD